MKRNLRPKKKPPKRKKLSLQKAEKKKRKEAKPASEETSEKKKFSFAQLKEKKFVLVYLYSEKIEENIWQIKKERSDNSGNEMWYPLMLRYLNETPYGKKHPFEGVADMAAHFRKRMEMELKIIERVIGEQAIILPAKEYEMEEVIQSILQKQ